MDSQPSLHNQPEYVVSEDKETLEYITPFALAIDPSLIGLPLAKPWKRGVAILIDSAIIGMLSGINGFFLILALLFLFARMGNKKAIQDSIFSSHQANVQRSERRILWGVGLALIFVTIIFFLFVDGFNRHDTNADPNEIGVTDGLSTGAALQLSMMLVDFENELDQHACSEKGCWATLLSSLGEKLTAKNISAEAANEIVSSYIAKTGLSELDQAELKKSLLLQENRDITISEIEKIAEPEAAKDSPTYSIINWIKGILGDLGLSFGWATFYFTVFISYWHGQTPGKKLLRIQVIQIDATSISLWDSFGRYGGYAAGISTGLLGFLQIYWDPNRQAIQDKISATFVIDLSRKRR